MRGWLHGFVGRISPCEDGCTVSLGGFLKAGIPQQNCAVIVTAVIVVPQNRAEIFSRQGCLPCILDEVLSWRE